MSIVYPLNKFSRKSTANFLRYSANKQTDKRRVKTVSLPKVAKVTVCCTQYWW